MATKKRVAKKSTQRSTAPRKTKLKKAAARKTPAKTAAPRKSIAKNVRAKPPARKVSARKNEAAAQRGAGVPRLFRINIEVGNLDDAARFYGDLLGLDGRRQAGSRVYFDAGGVTLQIVDVSAMGMGVPHPAAKALYFLVDDLDAVFARAQALGCLSREMVHGSRAGEISVRPWGERSFYAEDKWLNPLCFVEAGTVYPG
jgi:catechol 2,3-dioxygenase-like lactoylglutathione lyase family enzyme